MFPFPSRRPNLPRRRVFFLPGAPFYLPENPLRPKPNGGVIDGFRWSISKGRVPFSSDSLALSFIAVALLPVSGIWYFRKTERTFADVI
ncbi:MAG TPA: hypothetical protein VHW03_09185 [Chthoniobacterales bacterium]|nr:hypothetical protein [Chthoniobacterales bacterium]